MSLIFNPLPVPRFEEGMLSYLNESFQAISRAMSSNQSTIPTGTLQYTIADSEPDGWLFMNGQSVSRSSYADLESIVPSAWLSSNSIILPDWRGRVLVGAGTGSGLTNRTLGATGGAETHTLTIAEIPSHTHNIAWEGSAAGGLNQMIEYPPGGVFNDKAQDEPTFINYTGGGGSHNNMQPWAAANIMIKA